MGTRGAARDVGNAGIGALHARVLSADIAVGGGSTLGASGEALAPIPRSGVADLVRERIWTFVVWSSMAVWSGAVFAKVRADYADFLDHRGDLGNMTQAVWSTAHGRPLEMTSPLGEQVSRLSFHIDPILALLAPLWLLVPSPLTLGAVQVAACALGALPVFWLGRRHIGSENVAAMLAVAYLVYPWTAWNVLDAIHPVTLAMPLFLFAIWFLDSGRFVAFAACAVPILLCGELMGLSIASLGIWYWLSHKRRGGLAIAAAGFGWSVLAVKVGVPLFAGGPSIYYTHFEAVGGSPEAVLRTAFTDPLAIGSALTSGLDIVYVFLLLAPLAALPALAPGLVAVALPQLLANGLSERYAFVDPRAHYSSIVIALLFAATVFGVAHLPTRYRVGAAAIALVLSVASSLLMGVPHTRSGSPLNDRQFAARVDALREATALVPASAAVSATNSAGSHLSARRYFYSVPVVGRAGWIVVETSEAEVPGVPIGHWSPRVLRRFVSRIERSPRWTKVFDRSGVLVFKRVSA